MSIITMSTLLQEDSALKISDEHIEAICLCLACFASKIQVLSWSRPPHNSLELLLYGSVATLVWLTQ